MKFLCGNCRTKYQIADEKVRGKILTIRCKKCGEKVIVKESLAKKGQTAIAPLAADVAKKKAEKKKASSIAKAFESEMASTPDDDSPTRVSATVASNSEASADGIEWFTAIDGNQHGPFSFDELLRQIRAEELIGRNYVWHDGFGPWIRVRDCEDLKDFLKTPAPAKKPTTPPPPPIDAEDEIVPLTVADKKKPTEEEAPTSEEEAKLKDDDESKDDAETSNETISEPLGALKFDEMGEAESALSADSFSVGNESSDIDPDSLFRAVGSSAEAEEGPRESTAVFVAAAGVNAQKSRGKLGMVIGVAAAALLAVGVYSLYSGKISIGARVESPFAKKEKKAEPVKQAKTQKLSAEEQERLRQELTSKKKNLSIAELARSGKKKARARTVSEESAALDKDTSEGVRGGSEDAVSIQFPKGSSEFSKPKIKPMVPDTDLSGMEVPSTGRLDQSMIRQVVNQRKSSMGICYQRELRGNSKLGGKVEFLVTVEPSGTVSKSVVRTEKFKGSGLAECFADKIMSWRFPEFSGQAQKIIVPFVLQKRNTY
ncbi:MAG: AgmX/PglI C-terminal domain-containing protein [Myxococcota bacterium]|nr:AgmX/PglI C-terminal domain-containing protein [Myxococcota bacterium]